MKIRDKNRKWLIHYNRLGIGHENFSIDWPFDANGMTGVQAFAVFESTGVKHATRSPETIRRLTAGKKLHGINVDMYAQDRASAMMSMDELKGICNELPGMLEEVERLKVRYWPKTFKCSK